jgi:hypothetical protein
MDNKILGSILIIVCILSFVVIFSFNQKFVSEAEASCSCEDSNYFGAEGSCPHAKQNSWQMYLGVIVASVIAALGLYLIFFDKSHKKIMSTLDEHRIIKKNDEKFSILLMGLNEEEKKVIIAVKDQDGITQQTLRLRTGLHKSKLSIVISDLQAKKLIEKVPKGKTNQIFLKIAL